MEILLPEFLHRLDRRQTVISSVLNGSVRERASIGMQGDSRVAIAANRTLTALILSLRRRVGRYVEVMGEVRELHARLLLALRDDAT